MWLGMLNKTTTGCWSLFHHPLKHRRLRLTQCWTYLRHGDLPLPPLRSILSRDRDLRTDSRRLIMEDYVALRSAVFGNQVSWAHLKCNMVFHSTLYWLSNTQEYNSVPIAPHKSRVGLLWDWFKSHVYSWTNYGGQENEMQWLANPRSHAHWKSMDKD